MLLIEKIQNVFPRATDIPEDLLKDIPCIQTGYLADGEIRVWDGPRQEVLSPIWVAGDTGPKPFFIGEYPLLTEAEAFQALDAAVAAYDHGRGLWPTLSVAERIDHMERFAFRMIEAKDRVVRFRCGRLENRFRIWRGNSTGRLNTSTIPSPRLKIWIEFLPGSR
jgi:glyceraldehyde-3-phosphate dehydrogenase (NADP+)